MKRNKPSAPAKWIHDNIGFDHHNTLDYGCGRGFDANHYNIVGWDPTFDWTLNEDLRYDTILCTYVLNTIPSYQDRAAVIAHIKSILTPSGVAYITVRNDKRNLNGWTSRNTYQTLVNLNLPIVRKVSGYTIYQLMPSHVWKYSTDGRRCYI